MKSSRWKGALRDQEEDDWRGKEAEEGVGITLAQDGSGTAASWDGMNDPDSGEPSTTGARPRLGVPVGERFHAGLGSERGGSPTPNDRPHTLLVPRAHCLNGWSSRSQGPGWGRRDQKRGTHRRQAGEPEVGNRKPSSAAEERPKAPQSSAGQAGSRAWSDRFPELVPPPERRTACAHALLVGGPVEK